MSKTNRKIEILDTAISISRIAEEDFISLTDITRHQDKKRSDDLIRNRNTLEFLGIWEKFITPILIPSNSTGLECRQVSTALTSCNRWVLDLVLLDRSV